MQPKRIAAEQFAHHTLPPTVGAKSHKDLPQLTNTRAIIRKHKVLRSLLYITLIIFNQKEMRAIKNDYHEFERSRLKSTGVSNRIDSHSNNRDNSSLLVSHRFLQLQTFQILVGRLGCAGGFGLFSLILVITETLMP